ncbi:carboxypeptidase-like regulatory domain-containing protein [Pendulispora brunnea]|uniref:Carboxypeptidase-like regulatory domain-containing protein n=1 Tax=Pendulispora brunnea TaxID=2905690 RepID=A0ABZ2KUX0_9BACT
MLLRAFGPLGVVSVFAVVVLAPACGSSGDSQFSNPGADAALTDDGAGGSFGGPGDGGTTVRPCTHLCLQQTTCPAGGTTSLSGTVRDPAGRVPLYNVIVYVPNGAVSPLTRGASCDRCGNVSGDPLVSTITDTSGHFKLTNVPVGNDIPVVIQVGKWRRRLHVDVTRACQDTTLAAEQTRLPRNKGEGDIPLMALTTGGADALECFLRKVGLDDSEFTAPGGPGRVHLYAGSPATTRDPQGNVRWGATARFDDAHGGAAFGDAGSLWSSAGHLKEYDMVLLSCEGQTYPMTKPQAALDALYDYTAAGGRVFASHWHRYWFHPNADGNGPALGTTKFTDLGDWDDGNELNGIEAKVETTLPDGKPFPKGQAMKEWLGNVQALTPAGELPIDGAKKNLASVNPANATQWITYAPAAVVQYMSFNVPLGVSDEQKCGRAVYSDLHVSSGVGDQYGPDWPQGCLTTSLSPQEKALEFMLFDLSACIQSDTGEPAPPPVH